MSAIVLNDTEFSTGDLWVFGYGSLMWRPGFEFIERVPARLIGEHRALCVYSLSIAARRRSRASCSGSTAAAPARGVAFRVAERNSAATIAYLREREQVTSVYREVKRSVWLENEARQRVSALVYVVDRGHVQYAGRLSPAEQLRHVLQGHRPVRRQPRLCSGHREGDRGGRVSRFSICIGWHDLQMTRIIQFLPARKQVV